MSDDINEQLLAKLDTTERNIVRKENAEIEMMSEINLGMLTTLKGQISKMNERDKLTKKVKDLLMSRIELNPDELDLPTPYVIKLMEVLMAADSRDTGNFMQLMKSEKQEGGMNPSPDPINKEPERHMKKEEIKDNKTFLKILDQIKSAVEEIEKTEDSD